MAAFDWVILVIVLISIITAAAEGFFFELFSFGGAIFGFLIAAWNYWRLSPWLEQYVKSTAAAHAAGFVVIFCAVALLAGAAGKMARWMMKQAGLRWIDRVLGAAFGLVRGLVVVTALVLAATAFLPRSPWLEKSELSRYFLLSARIASWLAPGDLRASFKEGLAVIRNSRMQDAAPTVQNTEQGTGSSNRP